MVKLTEEISIEKEYIEKTLKLLAEASSRSEKSTIELTAIGSFLHHCYSGMENILNRIWKFKNIKIPGSSSSHKDLLNIAVAENIISQDLSDILDKYRGFRHFFIHSYGIMLEEEELQPLANNLPEVWNRFEQEIENFNSDLIVVYGCGATLIQKDWDLLLYADMARWEIQKRFRKNEISNIGINNKDVDFATQYKQAYFVDWRVCDKHKRKLFEKIDWSDNDHIYSKMVEVASADNLDWAELELWYNMRQPGDIEFLARDINAFRLAGDERSAKHTEKVLETLLKKFQSEEV